MELYDLMNKCNNYFISDYENGDFVIQGKVIELNGSYKVNQYIRIINSLFNDGIYKIVKIDGKKIELDNGVDEEFNGYVCALRVPNDFIKLLDKINEYEKRIKKGISSESIPNYSISYNNEDYSIVFKGELSKYIKPYRGKFEWIKTMDMK